MKCQNPTLDCPNEGDVEFKHNRTDEDGNVLKTTTIGWLCPSCAMAALLNLHR